MKVLQIRDTHQSPPSCHSPRQRLIAVPSLSTHWGCPYSQGNSSSYVPSPNPRIMIAKPARRLSSRTTIGRYPFGQGQSVPADLCRCQARPIAAQGTDLALPLQHGIRMRQLPYTVVAKQRYHNTMKTKEILLIASAEFLTIQ